MGDTLYYIIGADVYRRELPHGKSERLITIPDVRQILLAYKSYISVSTTRHMCYVVNITDGSIHFAEPLCMHHSCLPYLVHEVDGVMSILNMDSGTSRNITYTRIISGIEATPHGLFVLFDAHSPCNLHEWESRIVHTLPPRTAYENLSDSLLHYDTEETLAPWPPFVPRHTCIGDPSVFVTTHRFTQSNRNMCVVDSQWQARRTQVNVELLAASQRLPGELVAWIGATLQ